MKANRTRTLLLAVGISCLVALGNGQDGGTSSSGAVYGTQGSAARNKQIHDREMQQAIQKARQMKALKAAMAAQAQAQRQRGYTTASQFMEANRPPVSVATDGSATDDSDSDSASSGTSSSSGQSTVPDFQPSNESSGGGTPGVPDPSNPYASPSSGGGDASGEGESAEPAGRPAPPPPPRGNRPQRDSGGDGGLLAKLFGGGNDDDRSPTRRPSSESGRGSPGNGSPGTTSGATSGRPGASEPIPEPAETSSGPAMPESQPSERAPIFVNRPESTASEGEPATVASRIEADVEGVAVTLYEGTGVTILEQRGDLATIRLPDGRTGTVDATALGR